MADAGEALVSHIGQSKPGNSSQTAKYIEILSETAQGKKGTFVSFHSFLGIKAEHEEVQTESSSRVGSEELADRAHPAATSSAALKQEGPLSKVGICEESTRNRPTRGEPSQWGSKKDAESAIHIPLAGNKTTSKGSGSKKSSEAKTDAQNEVPGRPSSTVCNLARFQIDGDR